MSVLLHLVRHGRPRVDPSRPPAEWDLDERGVDDVRALRGSGALPLRARWISSDEPKAVQTAALLTNEAVGTDPALREQVRPAGWVDAYAVQVHRSLVSQDTPASPGWETAASTRSRVVAAVSGHLERAEAGGVHDLVLVGHGTAWTLTVAALRGKPVDLYAWERLVLPDLCVLRGKDLVRPWGDWRD